MRRLLHNEILKERLSIEQAKKTVRHPVSLLLHNIRSLYNVGSIFRTCDSALCKELILSGFTSHPPRREIEKTALGAVDTVPWRYFKDTSDAIHTLKGEGNKVFALEITDRKRYYTSLQKDEFPLVIVLGNELVGIDQDVLELCDDAIEIPMFGVKHSLNVAVAAGIVLFETVRLYRRYYMGEVW
ncbi:MAG: RNA methyltransferase [Candidatus Kapaibacteriota bacterium]|jgi:tRNA G18 (ribose-2'-O)-methylase SpoU